MPMYGETFNSVAENQGLYIPQVDESITEALPRIYIFNVGPKAHSVSKGGLGEFVIPACEAGQKVSKPLIIRGKHPEHFDVGSTAMQIRYEDGMLLAKDIVGVDSQDKGLQFMTSNLEWHGVFITKNAKPTDEEIGKAKAKRRERNLFLVREADNFHLRGQHSNILEPHRTAAIEEKQRKIWATEPSSLDDCPACGSQIKPGIAICPNCSAVLNEEAARRFFPGRFTAPEPEPVAVDTKKKA